MERELNANERYWLKTLFQGEFPGKGILQEQINQSLICPNYNNAYISLMFKINPKCAKFPFGICVPVGLIAYQQKIPPVAMLLHVVNGYIDELEIFNAGGYEISDDFLLDNVEMINTEVE